MSTSQITKLDDPIKLSWGTIDTLEVVYSSKQDCDFLLAYGVDSDGEPMQEVVSVNLQPDAFCQHGQFFVRTDNFNKDLVAELIRREILIDTGISQPSGWIRIPLFQYTLTEE